MLHFLLVVLKPPWKLCDVDNGDEDVCRLVLVLSKGSPLHPVVMDTEESENFVPVAQVLLSPVASTRSYSSISSSFG